MKTLGLLLLLPFALVALLVFWYLVALRLLVLVIWERIRRSEERSAVREAERILGGVA